MARYGGRGRPYGNRDVTLGLPGIRSYRFSDNRSATRIRADLGGVNRVGWGGAAAGPTAYDAEIDADSPLAHWKLNEASGSFVDRKAGFVLGPVGTVNYGQPGLLAAGNGADTAASFAAAARAVRASSTELALTTPFSIEAWVQPSSIGAQQSIIFKGDNSVYWTYGLEIVASGAFEFWVNGRGPFAQGGAAVAGTTYHVVGTYDEANISVYVNGALVATAAAVVAIGSPENAAPFQVSGRTSALTFSGPIDEVAYYPSALSLARIQSHYSVGSGAAAQSFSRTASEAFTISDSANVSTAHPRSAADSFAVSDAATRQAGAARTASDALAVSDAATRAAAARARTAGDTVAVSDAVSRTGAMGRSASDAFSVADAASRTQARARSASDAFTAADAATRLRSGARTASEVWSTADAATRAQSGARTATDAFAVSDSTGGAQSFTATATDAFAIADAASRTMARARGAADAWAAGDSTSRTAGSARTSSDAWSISDTAGIPVKLLPTPPARGAGMGLRGAGGGTSMRDARAGRAASAVGAGAIIRP